MSDTPKLYIAGMGMITPVGANTAMTAAAVRAGISAYAITEYTDYQGMPITMASVPDLVFDKLDADIGEGDRYDPRHFHVIKMAIIAIREACARLTSKQPIPLILAMPEALSDVDQEEIKELSPLTQALAQNCSPWIEPKQCRTIHSGRAAGLEALSFAFRYLNDIATDYVLIGGSDSYRDDSRLDPLCENKRLMVPGNQDGFAPGEAAAFLLLTKHPELALVADGHIIALHPPGIAEEAGHLGSDEPYRGDGLDRAFKQALMHREPASIEGIYSSMNGENHWAREYGVAFMRNKADFAEAVKIEHPADCYGDLGCATGPALIALAAHDLFRTPGAKSHLAYSSSDSAKRGAVVVEKCHAI
jgi:3-oxoacyl-[acyl-carrier-protein] synthase-1